MSAGMRAGKARVARTPTAAQRHLACARSLSPTTRGEQGLHTRTVERSREPRVRAVGGRASPARASRKVASDLYAVSLSPGAGPAENARYRSYPCTRARAASSPCCTSAIAAVAADEASLDGAGCAAGVHGCAVRRRARPKERRVSAERRADVHSRSAYKMSVHYT
jgi:hypothetical protein